MPEPRNPPAAAKPAAKPAPAAAGKPAAGKPAADAAPGGEPTSRVSWVLGWIVAPASVVGAIYGGGVLLGAHSPDGWFARSVMWVVSIF